MESFTGSLISLQSNGKNTILRNCNYPVHTAICIRWMGTNETYRRPELYVDCISSWLITVICGLGYRCCIVDFSIELCAEMPPLFFDGENVSSKGPLHVLDTPLLLWIIVLPVAEELPAMPLLLPCLWSQCKTTVTRPLLSMIFQDGVSSCNSNAWIVSHTIRGIADIATIESNWIFNWLRSENYFDGYIPAFITSTPVGYHRSPCLRSNSTVLFANVRKYSPSSICVPSHSRTTRTGSEAGTPSLSLPVYSRRLFEKCVINKNMFCDATEMLIAIELFAHGYLHLPWQKQNKYFLIESECRGVTFVGDLKCALTSPCSIANVEHFNHCVHAYTFRWIQLKFLRTYWCIIWIYPTWTDNEKVLVLSEGMRISHKSPCKCILDRMYNTIQMPLA